MKIFLLFHMCHFAMGLTHCYKITVVYTYIEETQDSDNDSFKVGSSQLRLYDKTLSSNKYTRNYYSPFTRSFNSSTSYLNGAGSLPPPPHPKGAGLNDNNRKPRHPREAGLGPRHQEGAGFRPRHPKERGLSYNTQLHPLPHSFNNTNKTTTVKHNKRDFS